MTEAQNPPPLDGLADALARHHLSISGLCAVKPSDNLPVDQGTLVMVSPDEPAFWPAFTESTEYSDGGSDPLDRWSTRVLTLLAMNIGGTAIFPFGGPPYYPFLDWAKRSGRVWSSPVGLLVHDQTGLFTSYRGAILITEKLPIPVGTRPCDSCEQPCVTACPVSALTSDGYDVPSCKAYIATRDGHDCLHGGCAVRRACPVGAGRRGGNQSAFHIKAFLGP